MMTTLRALACLLVTAGVNCNANENYMGTRKVMLVQLTEDINRNPSDIESAAFSTSDFSVSSQFTACSYGQFSIVPAVNETPVITVPGKLTALVSDAFEAARNKVIDELSSKHQLEKNTDYDYLIIAYSYEGGGQFGVGWWQVPGDFLSIDKAGEVKHLFGKFQLVLGFDPIGYGYPIEDPTGKEPVPEVNPFGYVSERTDWDEKLYRLGVKTCLSAFDSYRSGW